MRVESVHNIYRTSPQGMRVVEWKTVVADGRHYVRSRAYTVSLYSREGKLETYNQQSNIDVIA